MGVYIGAGSRHEDLETSGSAYLLEKMFMRGTKNRSKNDIVSEIENNGARFYSSTDRESSTLSLKLFKEHVNKGV